jgi:hypothetical protein
VIYSFEFEPIPVATDDIFTGTVHQNVMATS